MFDSTTTRELIAAAIFERRDNAYDVDEWDDLSMVDKELWLCYADAALDALASRPAPAETPSETDFWTCGRCGNLTPLDLATPPAPVGEGEREELADVMIQSDALDSEVRARAMDPNDVQREPFRMFADAVHAAGYRKVVS